MINLISTADLVQIVTSSTQSIQVQASYVDVNGSTYTPGRTNAVISTATTTAVVPSPGTGVSRNLKSLSIYNNGSASETVTVQHTDGTNVVTLFSVSLPATYAVKYDDASGWKVFDSNGNMLQNQGAAAVGATGRFVKRTVILNGTTTFTTQANTTSIVARLQAAGGAGGGCAATSNVGGGSGGASGGYAEWAVAVTGSTGYTCAVGAGGTGVSAANGNAGGNTTLTIGATTCTAFGGPGGIETTSATASVAGAAAPSVSTNGTLNGSGSPGGNGASGAIGSGGEGGSSVLGAGGQGSTTQGTGNAAGGGFGGGGGGAFTTAATARTGGGGANGVLIIDEYT